MHKESGMSGYSLMTLTLLITFILPSLVFGQKSVTCADRISQAEALFESGLFNQIEKMDFTDCLRFGFNDKEKSRYYKLRILMHLYSDQDAQAQEMMETLLKHDPEYAAIKGEDPAEFLAMHDRFDTRPVGLVELRTGVNYMRPNPIGGDYGTQPAGTGSDLINARADVIIGLQGEKYLTNNISVTGGLFYSARHYKFSQYFRVYDKDNEAGDSKLELTFNERQQWVDLPIQLHLNFRNERKIRPYVYVGVTGHYLLNASMRNVQRNFQVLPDDKQFESRIEQVTTDKIDIVSDTTNTLRKRPNLSYHAGVGLQFKVGHNFIVVDYQVANMIVSLPNANNRYSNHQLVYTYGYVDDDFLQTTQSLTIGFKHIFYDPKLKKSLR